MRPVIGINCDLQEGNPLRIFLYSDYFQAVERAGGIPVLLPPLGGAKDIEELLRRLDGLVLSGGDDIWPERYGQTRHAKTVPVTGARDIFDFQLVRMALGMGVPILGICYGAQLINVALGGSLIQDIPSERPTGLSHKAETGHKVIVERGTRLYELLKAEVLTVNSSHHQAIDRLGEGLRVSAMAEDGIVEAVEGVGYPLVIGVQWHPERMAGDSAQRGLFTAFLEEVKGRATKRQ